MSIPAEQMSPPSAGLALVEHRMSGRAPYVCGKPGCDCGMNCEPMYLRIVGIEWLPERACVALTLSDQDRIVLTDAFIAKTAPDVAVGDYWNWDAQRIVRRRGA